MNSLYGKHGQRSFDRCELGDMHTAEERMLEVSTIPGISDIRRTIPPKQ